MPNLNVGLGLAIITITAANAATIKFGGGTCTGSGGQTCPAAGLGGIYYKCSNTFSGSCSNYAGTLIYYTGTNGGSGTSASPYILTGCSLSGCVCDSSVPWTSSGCGSACSYGLRAVPASATGQALYHQNTKCSYCGYNQYVYTFSPAPNVTVSQCNTCPNSGTSDGTGDITSCCLAANWTGSDDTGTFKCGSSTCYKN
ncbi:MAG: hypothetical protein IKW09_00760 [Alphaproteobacteria bacterium]|nr:hypothetical protein [Alphaproteobacteria bacterium]